MTGALLAAAVAAMLGGQAAPAPEPSQADLRRNAYAVQLSFRVADCIVDGGRRESIALLQQTAGTLEELNAFEAIRRHSGRCYERIGREDSQIRMPLRLLRAQIAEALYRRDFGSARSQRSPASLPAPDPRLQGSEKVDIRRSAVALGFAACVANARPAEAATLLTTTPYSTEEQAVMDRLSSHFSGCLTQGSELQINYPLFRGFVAEALYRQRAAPRP